MTTSAPTSPDSGTPDARPVLLAIGGVDPTGRAGLAADIRAGEAAGVHVAPVPVALTAQNADGVTHIEPATPLLIHSQVRAVLEDLPVAAVKIGLMPSAQVVGAVVEALALLPAQVPMIIDPVMGASSGGRLVPAVSRSWCRQLRLLCRRATLLTPNILEASALLVGELPAGGRRIMRLQARALRERYGCDVLLKGGHLPNGQSVIDVLAMKNSEETFISPRLPAPDLRGTGCTLATLIAAHMAHGQPLLNAVATARRRLLEGLSHIVPIGGRGAPPVRLPVSSDSPTPEEGASSASDNIVHLNKGDLE